MSGFDFTPSDHREVVADRSGEIDLDLETLLVIAEQKWLIDNSRITLTEALELCDHISYEISETTANRVLSSPEFKARMDAKGIFWPDKWNDTTSTIASVLTPHQLAAIAVMTDPTKTGPIKAKLESVGVSYATYRNWMKNPHFKNSMTKVGEELLNESMAAVHSAVANRATSGDMGAAKLYYDVTGRLTSDNSQMRDLGQIINLLLEVITRHITDVGILSRINKDVEVVLSGGNLHTPDAIEAHNPNDIEDAVVVDELPAEGEIAPGFFDFSPENEDHNG